MKCFRIALAATIVVATHAHKHTVSLRGVSAGHISKNHPMRYPQGGMLEERTIAGRHRKLPSKNSGKALEFPLEGSLLVCSSGKHDWMQAVEKRHDCGKGTLYEFPLQSSQTEDLEGRLAKLEKKVFPDLHTEESSAQVCIQTETKKKDKGGRMRSVTGSSDCDSSKETHRFLYLPNDMDERISLLEAVVFLREEGGSTRAGGQVQVCAGDTNGRMRSVGDDEARCQDTDRLSLLPVGIIDVTGLENRVTELEEAVWTTPSPTLAPTPSPVTPSPVTPSPVTPSPVIPTPQPTHVKNTLIRVFPLMCPVGTNHVDDLGFLCDLHLVRFELIVAAPKAVGMPNRSGCSEGAEDGVAGGGGGGCSFCDEDDSQNTKRTLNWLSWSVNGGNCVHADMAKVAHDFQEMVLLEDGVDFCSLDFDVQDGGTYITETLPTKFEGFLESLLCD